MLFGVVAAFFSVIWRHITSQTAPKMAADLVFSMDLRSPSH